MRLNLNGAIAGLGHGLATLGQQGIEEQQRVAADARLQARETAMASINHDYRTSEANDSSKREISQYAASTPDVVEREMETSAKVRIPERQVEAQVTRDNADHNSARDFREQMALMNVRDRMDFNRWRQQHNIEQGDTRSLELWRQEHQIGGEGSSHYLRDATTGHYITEDRNGVQRDTGIAFPVAGGDDLLDDDGSGGTPAAAAPTGRGGRPVIAAPRPVARGNDTPPVAGARRGADNQWYVTRGGRNFLVQGN